MLKSSFILNKTLSFTRIIALTMTLSSRWSPRCARLGFGREHGATESGASTAAETGPVPEVAGQTQGARAAVTPGTGAQSGARRMHGEEAVSPRQGQECLRKKRSNSLWNSKYRVEEQTQRAEATRPETQGCEQSQQESR